MRAVFGDGWVSFHREEGDRRYHGMRFAKGEHNLLHFIAKWLNERGFAVIKKRIQKDNHMMGDEYQPYIRCRDRRKDFPHVYIYSGFYALYGANEDWNKNGQVTLLITSDCWESGQDTMAMIAALCKGRDDMRVTGDACGLHALHVTGVECV